MTIRKTINMGEITSSYTNFRDGLEAAPEGTFTRARELHALVNDMMDSLFEHAEDRDIRLNNTDHCYEVESMIFDFVLRSNTDSPIEALQVIGLGSLLENVSSEYRDRIIEGLKRDHALIEAHREAV